LVSSDEWEDRGQGQLAAVERLAAGELGQLFGALATTLIAGTG
jgi:hypothetical protein